jgi:hypothetical protein
MEVTIVVEGSYLELEVTSKEESVVKETSRVTITSFGWRKRRFMSSLWEVFLPARTLLFGF